MRIVFIMRLPCEGYFSPSCPVKVDWPVFRVETGLNTIYSGVPIEDGWLVICTVLGTRLLFRPDLEREKRRDDVLLE
jgi:hypothetical protein